MSFLSSVGCQLLQSACPELGVQSRRLLNLRNDDRSSDLKVCKYFQLSAFSVQPPVLLLTSLAVCYSVFDVKFTFFLLSLLSPQTMV